MVAAQAARAFLRGLLIRKARLHEIEVLLAVAGGALAHVDAAPRGLADGLRRGNIHTRGDRRMEAEIVIDVARNDLVFNKSSLTFEQKALAKVDQNIGLQNGRFVLDRNLIQDPQPITWETHAQR